jgi:ABC-2 type transport system permease protein
VTSALPGWVANVYLCNPITLAIFGLQRTLWRAGADVVMPDSLMARLGIALAAGLVLLFLAQRVFDRLQRNFAQEL